MWSVFNHLTLGFMNIYRATIEHTHLLIEKWFIKKQYSIAQKGLESSELDLRDLGKLISLYTVEIRIFTQLHNLLLNSY